MKKERFSLDMSLEEREKRLLEVSDEEIDLSDIPELDEEFFNPHSALQITETANIKRFLNTLCITK